ncbi:RagB/SusD family nutrient uptake outer membrane protein [Flavobacteriaceae bacterium F89]|uniref:RagB/SusD family nutrient uptake outer membrane protein n=1 Tax=Cerina litoralis TaxID=2874477 RepID=A0AAE3EYI2_9FLAO|nr:RagB/SusD family nutrient uptake outer membrane protein [Cerina litoralis]MCG2462504.1 RagB/SusD family nutrient uptake outer membrane protein [Cerina litoralis]
MKNRKYRLPYIWIVNVAFSALLMGCSDYLDVEPSAIRSGDNFVTNDENAVTTVNSIYNILAGHERWQGGLLESSSFYIGEILADFSEMGAIKGDYDDLERMIEWRPFTDEIILYGIWKRSYDGIYRSDYVLGSLPDAPIDPELKKRLLGEAYFLKGMNILRLVKVFGNVPLGDGIIPPDQYGNIPQKTMHEGFEMAADNFRKSIVRLPKRSEYSLNDLGRATEGAAQSMLARLYMLQAGMDKDALSTAWDSVYHYTNKVIQSGEYSLVPNYASIQEPEGENNSESIFELQFGSSATLNIGLGGDRSAVGTTSQIRCGIRGAENEGLPGGWGYFQPTQLLVNEFEPNDPRLSSCVYGPNYNDGIVYGVARNYNLSQMQSEYYNRKLAIDPETEASDLATSASNSSRNLRVMRYADVLLMHAEAAYYTGKEGEALIDIEMVRERARNSTNAKGFELGSDNYVATGNSNSLPMVNASGVDLLHAIWHERSVELALEDMRYWDLVRTGRYLDRLDVIKNTSKDPMANELRFANIDLRGNCQARCIEGPRGIKDIPMFPIPGAEAIKWNLKQVIGIY